MIRIVVFISVVLFAMVSVGCAKPKGLLSASNFEHFDEGWEQVKSVLPDHNIGYWRANAGNFCSVSLFRDGSGVTARTTDPSDPKGFVMHSIAIRKIEGKISRKDTWSIRNEAGEFTETSPGSDLYLTQCLRLLPDLPAAVRALFHGIYTDR